MSRSHYHTVAQHETARSIGATYGVSPEALWSHERNSALRSRREPNVLFPGDRIWIPEPSSPLIEYGRDPVPCRTGRSHVFCAAQLHEISVRFQTSDETVKADWNYRLEFRDESLRGTLDAEGQLAMRLPMSVQRVQVYLWPPSGEEERASRVTLLVAALDPVTESSGLQQRLANLGFPSSSADSLRSALLRFQACEGISPTGELDDPTRSALLGKHGS